MSHDPNPSEKPNDRINPLDQAAMDELDALAEIIASAPDPILALREADRKDSYVDNPNYGSF
jgi:hypothetical protein